MTKIIRWFQSDKLIRIPLGFTTYIYESKSGRRRFAFGFKQQSKYYS